MRAFPSSLRRTACICGMSASSTSATSVNIRSTASCASLKFRSASCLSASRREASRPKRAVLTERATTAVTSSAAAAATAGLWRRPHRARRADGPSRRASTGSSASQCSISSASARGDA